MTSSVPLRLRWNLFCTLLKKKNRYSISQPKLTGTGHISDTSQPKHEKWWPISWRPIDILAFFFCHWKTPDTKPWHLIQKQSARPPHIPQIAFSAVKATHLRTPSHTRHTAATQLIRDNVGLRRFSAAAVRLQLGYSWNRDTILKLVCAAEIHDDSKLIFLFPIFLKHSNIPLQNQR